ncbi:GlxA family transcriptional regulator [Massilia sp. AB1]|uniref:GlxA family transcriptional regulator n=1 Tax=Massilia sp. AB1 TaxID=2823371 RepID=UPI001B83D7A9|nr:helix-turn-helix domain-containing protein [Massilia sp. AB1]MBQ5940281.1 helix-turn-helix domain-containing protein [Massilia sp. AB1]
MRIVVLALNAVFDTGLATVLDAFRTAGELAGPHAPFELTLAGVRAEVRSAQGLGVPVVPVESCGVPDLVIVPAIGYKMPEPLAQALASEEVRDAGLALRRWAEQGVRIAAPCIGAFVLAETGLLDGHEATCTWWLTPMFRERHPHVGLDARRMVVQSGQFVTAGAALGHLDLALWLIRQSSPELAALVARYLIVDARPSQSAYVISDHLLHHDPLVAGFDRWAREHLAKRFSLEAAAGALATSKRTLARRMADTLGKTPVEHVQDLRIERAVHLLRTSDSSVERIAEQVGYKDGATLRSLLRKRLGKGVRELRNPSFAHTTAIKNGPEGPFR